MLWRFGVYKNCYVFLKPGGPSDSRSLINKVYRPSHTHMKREGEKGREIPAVFNCFNCEGGHVRTDLELM